MTNAIIILAPFCFLEICGPLYLLSNTLEPSAVAAVDAAIVVE